jgi:cysteinyl-tRNA synthetase
VARLVIAMTDVLGVNPLSATWVAEGGGGGTAAMDALDSLVQAQVAARAAARAARDFATADAIRDQLAAAGIQVEDTSSGARWSLVKSGGDN